MNSMVPDDARLVVVAVPVVLLPILSLSATPQQLDKMEDIMEIIRGKQTSFITTAALSERLAGYETIHIDIGTGDGRFVQNVAQTQARDFVIGIDACRENLQEVSRRAPMNALFVIANAQSLPQDLNSLGTHIMINFPWGSLMSGLLTNDAGLMESLMRIACPRANLEVRLNGGALAEQGWSLEEGADRVHEVLIANGFTMRPARLMTARDLTSCPTTWAKRLAFGRDPRAMFLRGSLKGRSSI